MRLIIAGGGTGGHLYPGVAIAEELVAQDPSSEVLFVGTQRGIEARVLPQLGWNLRCIEVSGLKTVGLGGWLRGMFRLPRALWQSRRILRQFRPDAVIGVGGYASGPLVLAASLRRLPTAILEQNSIPGFTNKLLGKFVRRVFVSFSETKRFFRQRKVLLTGNPIRKQILETLTATSPSRGPDALPHVFVCGGSQGATAVNQLFCRAAGLLEQRGLKLTIVHQTGTPGLSETQTCYQESGIKADCRAFIDNMAAEYKRADLVIARAGATTVAELMCVGKPAILIPYPYAADNHQEINATELVAGGGARLARQSDTTPETLTNIIAELVANPAILDTMGSAMNALARPRAAQDIVSWCKQQVRS